MLELALAFVVQCPDGSPPPCARPQQVATAPALDPRRIAILPFRVTSTDTLFGEGLAELLANELSTDDLRAAHMGSVLRVWRRAGGGMRTPLDQSGTLRVARELGAGRVVDGSVVGIGQRLTLSASVVTVPDGATRRVGPISGTVDSIESLVGRLASGLLGAAGTSRVDLQVRLTDSPDAMRAYLEGLAHFRRREIAPARDAFERAIGFDSGFARAAFMRYQAATFATSPADLARWSRYTRSLKDRLSRQDRVLMVATIGESDEQRSTARHLADRQQAVTMLPESPEALYELADHLFHSSGAHNRYPAELETARQLFQRSLAIDSQAVIAEHLLELALWLQDTAQVRALWPVFEHLSADSNTVTARGLIVAEFLADAQLRARLARRTAGLTAWHAPVALLGLESSLGAGAMRRVMDALPAPVTPGGRRNLPRFTSMTSVATGQPGRLAEARRAVLDSGGARFIDYVIVGAALFEGFDSTTADAAVARMFPFDGRDSTVYARLQCVAGLWRQRHGQPPGHDAGLLRRHGSAPCAAALDLQDAWRARAPDVEARILTLDSILRVVVAEGNRATFFENRVLARVLEERGNRPAALNAIRLRFVRFGFDRFTFASDYREEGRLAALTGDTTGAILAYRQYLSLRRDAEPSLIPQRDSVAAALTALQGRR